MKKLIIGFVFVLVLSNHQVVSAQDVGDAAPDFTVDLTDGGTFTLSEER